VTARRATAVRRGADGRPWPDFAEALRVWGRIALLSFGGPAGQIAVMHRILVEEKRWLDDARFLHALNFCMLLPGPEAQQLTVYIGWLMHGVRGGIVAGLLFVLPGVVAIMALSWVYALWGEVAAVEAAFFGLKAAVLAIVLQAVVRIGRRALSHPALVALAAASFAAIFVFGVPFPAIVLSAGLIGWLGGRRGLAAFRGGDHAPGAAAGGPAATLLGREAPARDAAQHGGTAAPAAGFLVLWLAPVLLIVAALGPEDVFARIAVFFSQMAVLTFGGAYAVLAWVAQAAVETYGWLAPGEMLDGLGMAETTPGPLIMVVQFVGFMAAFRDPGGLPPLVAGTLGGMLTTWVTFAPCFAWIFLGAPHVERLRGNRAAAGALAAITAAVVGVILNLAVWFALHVIFREVVTLTGFGLDMPVPRPGSVDPTALLLVALALVAVSVLRVGSVPLLASAALLGLAAGALGLAGA
jgi:chromate transporter